MKRTILLSSVTLLAAAAFAADPKDAVKSAAKQLADKGNYSWKTTVAVPDTGGGGGARFRPGPTEGKTDKGTTFLAMTRGDTTMEAVLKSDKGALKLEGAWKSLSEAAEDDGSGQFSPGRFAARMLQNFKAPAAEAADLADKAKDLKTADGVTSGDLPADAVKQLLTFRRPGGEGPEVSGAKGSVKFWVKDGALAKYEYHVQGTISFNGNDREMDRTTTVDIKDVGTTSVTVPEGAAKKL